MLIAMTIQLRYYQQEAIDALYEYFSTKDGNPLVVLPTGCHAKGTMILMADGSTKPVEAIVVGDKLMGPDSCPRTVLRLCRGRQPMYRITPKKRAPFVVNRDHILALRCTNEGKGYPSNRNKSHQDFITVGEYMQKSAHWKHLRKLEYSAGVTFDRGEDEHPIPPWVLGALLGDGHLKRGISMTTPDAEVLGEFMECIKAFGMNHRTSYNDSGCPTVHAVGASWRNSPIRDALRELGLLGNLAVEKFVPDQYKFATWHARCEVLAGLLDTDGHKNKGGYDWISKSKRLAHDVVFIARSLGIKAQVSAQYKRCQTGAGGIYYRVSLSGDMTRLNMRVERKRADPRKQAKSPHVAGFTLEELGEDDYFGFTLDADHLYLDSEFLIHHNSGKSLTMADFAKGAIQSFPDTNLLLLTHVKELIQQDAQAIIRHWPQAPVGIWSAGLGAKQRNQITVAGIQSIHTHPAKFGRTDLVLVDEAHLISKRSDTMYGRFLAALRESNPALKVIGMTATPYRMDSGLLTQGEHRIFTDIAYEADVGRLIKEGYLCPLVARGTQAAKADLSGVHTRGGEFVEKELQAAMDKEHLIEGALDEVERLAADRNHILGFCAGVAHAAHCAERARARGWSADHVTGDMTAAERDAKINAFKEGRLRFLFNAMILTTGFDAPHIDCILMLRPTKSTGLYCLDEETEILTSQGWKGVGAVKVGDCAPAMCLTSGAGVWSPVLAVMERPAFQDESFVQYHAPRANFRVTDNHRMIWRAKKETDWKVTTAGEMAQNKDSVYMPTAVEIQQPGVPLTDAELYFIGMMMTDGTWSSHQATIVQSTRHPEIVERIEQCLDACGLAWTKARVDSPSVFPERHPRFRFSISAGKPRLGRPGTGFRHLTPYLDKDLSPALMALSKHQFETLLKGINDGDGFKTEKLPNLTWTPRSITICSARALAVDRLQALAAIHGYTANLRKEATGRKNPIYILTIKQRSWRSIGGCGLRPKVEVVPANGERVWCVETEAGTLVTRRRGKVTVMGNCQILGRGLRLHASKTETLVLDFAGNVERHGPIDQIRVKPKSEKGEGVSVAPVKECPNCQAFVHTAARECPECGHLFPEPDTQKHGTHAADAVVVAAIAQPKVMPVHRVIYEPWNKNGRKSLAVTYECVGGATYQEWVPIEDERSYVRKHAVRWFWERGAMCPATVQEALAMIRSNRIPSPEAILVKLDGKYWRVIEHQGLTRLDAHEVYEGMGNLVGVG